MKTTEVKFEIPENILNSLNQSIEEFTGLLRLVTALQLFENHKLSFGQAAELAGMSRENFLGELDKHKIDFLDYDPSELEDELNKFNS